MKEKRKNKYLFNKQSLAILLSILLLLGSIPEINSSAREASTSVVEVIAPTKLPEKETTKVEVFSEDGSIELVDVSVEDFEDVPFDESSAAELMDNAASAIIQDNNISISVSKQMAAQVADQLDFRYEDLVNNGSDSDNYCILIAGDGYTESEQEQFLATARRIADYFLAKSPFNESVIRDRVNIRAVCVESNQSGVSMDPNNLYDSFFKSSFNNAGIERLICIHDQAALDKVIKQYMPECNLPIVVGNSTVYGGSGGSVCVLSAHESAPEIAIHEFGHTGGGLADEYWETTTADSNGYEAPNRTANSDPNTCKWSDLIGVNNVGLYAFEENTAWYRPHQNCEMRYLNAEFCEVCKRQLRNEMTKAVDNKVDENVIITNASQLLDYASKVSAGAKTYGKKVTLANDITLSGSDNFPVMWNFDGTFDGNGHTIYNVNISTDSGNVGFIGTLGSDGIVKNLCLENVNVNVGGGAYYIGGLVGNCKGTILQCGVTGNVTGPSGAGGIAGHIESGLIQDCYNKATVRGSSQVAGGVVGWGDGGTVNNCWNAGSVSDNTNYWSGAICGYNGGSTTISNNYYLEGTDISNQGGAKKSASEFADGSVTNLLNSVNSVWKQGDGYPTFTYSSVDVGGNESGSGEGPTEVVGQLISSTTAGLIDVVWGAATNGQTYNVYINGDIAKDVTGRELRNIGCAAYQIPAGSGTHTIKITAVLNGKESAGVTGTVVVNGSDEVVTDGFTNANTDWTELDYWSVYFANSWGGDPRGSYKDGGSYSNFALKINNAGSGEWAVQMKTKAMGTTAGGKYICRIGVNSNMASENNIRIKDDISQVQKLQKLVQGSNTFELEFTAADTAQIFFDLGMAPAGLEFTITSFTLEKIEEPTTESKTEAPTTETKTEVPTTETKTEASTTETKTEAPTTETKTEAPTTETKTEAPTTETKTEAPTTETKTEASTTETKTEAPTTETKTEVPTTETKTEAPTTETKTEAPTTESKTEAPTTESKTETPTTETKTEVPTTETKTEVPTTENKTETPTTESKTETPSTENKTETPATESKTEIPSTENKTENPSTESKTEEGGTQSGGSGVNNDSNVDKFAVGTTFRVGKLMYKITESTVDGVNVQVLNPVQKTNKSITIPATVKYEGKTCKVTSIAENAFKNNRKLFGLLFQYIFQSSRFLTFYYS